MSIPVPFTLLETFSPKERRKIDKQLRVKEKADPKAFWKNLKEVAAYRQEGTSMAFPFHWAFQNSMFRNYRRPRECYDLIDCKFAGKLRPEQQIIQKEALQILNQQGSVLIAVYPGGGKTITSLNICSRIGLKTLVLVNRVVLMEQWKESVERFFDMSTTKVQIVESQDPLDPDAQFYVMNALNVPKRPASHFEKIGTVIVDECHMMITQVFIQALSYVFPRYLIGLSATPYRPDGLDVLLDLYFGTERIIRQLFRQHHVYCLKTGFKLEGTKDEKGKLSWNSVLKEQTDHEGRNHLIARLVEKFYDRSILVLCKRVDQINTLESLIKPITSVTTLKGNEVVFDREARVLVASIQKVGTGFSHEKLDMLILACDTEEYFLQYLGRVFRRPDVVPIVIDIVDKNPVLQRHWNTRKKVYENAGGSLFSFQDSFSDFVW